MAGKACQVYRHSSEELFIDKYISSRKFVSVSWANCCKNVEEGSPGFRNFHLSNFEKLAWSMNLLRKRFLDYFGVPWKKVYKFTLWLYLSVIFTELSNESRWLVRINSNLSFWKAIWLGYSLLEKLNIPETEFEFFSSPIKDFMIEGT